MVEGREHARRPTLADVAAAAGVSRTTASRALAESPNVSPAARDRVWAAARRLRFEPNHLARSLRRGSTMEVGLVVPDVAIAFYATALKGAQETLEAAGYHVLVMNTERTADRERAAVRMLRAHRVDGLILATSGGHEDIGVPAVFFDNVPAEIGVGGVAMDNEQGVRLLVEHLVDRHEHQRVAYIGPPDLGVPGAPSVHLAARERLDSFRAAVGRAGLPLPPEFVRTSDPACSEGVAAGLTAELMGLSRPPTAIVAGADTLAIGALKGVRAQGSKVPDDVALVSFDEPEYADVLDPPMTSLDRHDRELGRRAAEMLLAALTRLDGPPTEPLVVRVPLQLRVRRSCGCGAARVDRAVA